MVVADELVASTSRPSGVGTASAGSSLNLRPGTRDLLICFREAEHLYTNHWQVYFALNAARIFVKDGKNEIEWQKHSESFFFLHRLSVLNLTLISFQSSPLNIWFIWTLHRCEDPKIWNIGFDTRVIHDITPRKKTNLSIVEASILTLRGSEIRKAMIIFGKWLSLKLGKRKIYRLSFQLSNKIRLEIH